LAHRERRFTTGSLPLPFDDKEAFRFRFQCLDSFLNRRKARDQIA
jgi:hypothetical protein